MKNKTESIIQVPFFSGSKAKEKRIEFRRHKIVPPKDNILQKNTLQENEWQQEYFIIYNSYVLDEKDTEI